MLKNANDYKYSDLTQKIIGCAMKVHSYFGMGFPEVIYKRALIIELEKMNLQSAVEVEREIYYEEKLIGKRRLDLIVEDKVLIELKAISEIDKNCHNQIINYLNVFDFEVGLLLNFGAESLHFKRFVYSKNNQRNHQNNH